MNYNLTGVFLPLREIRKCVPEFLALNMIFLYLRITIIYLTSRTQGVTTQSPEPGAHGTSV